MSRIRHFVSSMQSDARNSSADANARTAKPNSRSRSGSDSRTDSSSSTTDTSERVVLIDVSCGTRTCGNTTSEFAMALVRGNRCDLQEVPPTPLEHRIENLDVSFSLGVLSFRNSLPAACTTTLRGVYSTLVLGWRRYQQPHGQLPIKVCQTSRHFHADRSVREYSRASQTAAAQGIENENVAPGPLFGVAHRRP